jgi:hypothetical protein
VPRCNIENTKRPELRFRAVLGAATREVRFERGQGKHLVEGVFSEIRPLRSLKNGA